MKLHIYVDHHRPTITAISLCAAIILLAACSSTPAVDDDPQPPAAVADGDAELDEPHDDHGHHGDKKHERGDEEHEHQDHHDHRFKDPELYAELWNNPERDQWQRPKAIIEAMEIEEGMTVADLGAGTGYFIPYLAEAVGEGGTVLAVDIEPSMLEYIDDMAQEMGLENVETVLAEPEDSGFEEASVDRLLTVNTWHHIPNRGQYSAHLRERLTEHGAVWIVDYHEDSPQGPPEDHRLHPDVVMGELEEGGLSPELVDLQLERQFVVVARR